MLKLFRLLSCAALLAATPYIALGASNEGLQELRHKLEIMVPGRVPDLVQETPIKGLYEVRYGLQVFYITANGRYVVRGDLVDLQSHTNLTQIATRAARAQTLATLPADSLLTYKAKGAVKHVIYVFSDLNCRYCQMLHDDLPTLNRHGIEVRYLFWPRAGLNSMSAREAESVWCAKDRQQAYDRAVNGGDVRYASCRNPVARDFTLGVQMGVQGTPTIILSNGKILPGYLPAPQLMEAIAQAQPQKVS